MLHSGAGFPANPNMINPDANPIRIVLVEEHTILRQALQMFFKAETGFEIIGEASDRAGALDVVSRTQPDIILLGLSVGEVSHRQIGERLFITEATVSHHLTSIFNKLDIPDRLQLIVFAHKHGLTGPDL